jgi:uncharacterized membrane protein
VDKFFNGEFNAEGARHLMNKGRIKYVFYSVQEKEKFGDKKLSEIYPFLKEVYSNDTVSIYSI